MNLLNSRGLRMSLLAVACAGSAVAQSVVFSNWPAPVSVGPNVPLVGNTYSYSIAANNAFEMGDRIQLAGTDRYITGGRFLLSSSNIWPNGTPPAPVPMNWVVRFYSLTTVAPISDGPLLGSATVTAMVPYRPTPFPRPLPDTGDFGGILFEVSFDTSAAPILVNDQIIVTFGPETFPVSGFAAAVNIGLQIASSETVIGFNVTNNTFWRRLASPTGNLTTQTRDTGIPNSDTYAPYLELTAAPTPEPSTWALIIGGLSLGMAAWYRRGKRETA